MADLQEGWRAHPPLQWMVQSYLGIGAKDRHEDDDFDAAVAAANGQG